MCIMRRDIEKSKKNATYNDWTEASKSGARKNG